jgi:hypothetical protein
MLTEQGKDPTLLQFFNSKVSYSAPPPFTVHTYDFFRHFTKIRKKVGWPSENETARRLKSWLFKEFVTLHVLRRNEASNSTINIHIAATVGIRVKSFQHETVTEML